MTWEVVAEKPRGARGWPTRFDVDFARARAKVEAGTHMMVLRYVDRPNPMTGEIDQMEQRIIKECAEPLQPFQFWSVPTGMAVYAGLR